MADRLKHNGDDRGQGGSIGAVRICVVRYGDRGLTQGAEVGPQIDRIFFEASSVQSFRDAAHREAFRWLWLGRYLIEEPEHALIARHDGSVCGYLVGSLDDPALRPAFDTLSYFRDFREQTARYPAHLHINVDAGMRGRGVGQLLVERFVVHALGSGCPGVHVVTGVGMRNVRFYERLGFFEVGRAPRNGVDVVMLAKDLCGGGA